MKPIKVFIIDDAILLRKILKKKINEQKNIQIVGTEKNRPSTLKSIHETKPDIIILNFVSTLLEERTLLDDIFIHHPLPTIVVGAPKFFDFRSKSAITYINKPSSFSEQELSRFLNELTQKTIQTFETKSCILPRIKIQQHDIPKKQIQSEQLVAIGASTGGTNATLQVLKNLPKNFPCILVVQHMPPGFTRQYAERLNRICQMHVKEAEEGDRIQNGVVLIAAGNRHLTLDHDIYGLFVHSKEGDKVSGHCPSVDTLFYSVAKHAAKNSIGVILTGMGRDGADGLLTMKKNGAFTIGQNEETCVVYGMPRAAYEIGAVQKQLPIDKISDALLTYVKEHSSISE